MEDEEYDRLVALASKGAVADVQRILQNGAHADGPWIKFSKSKVVGSSDKGTALLAASGAGHEDVVRALLDAGAEIDRTFEVCSAFLILK
jgi:hypothetical protein